MPSRPHTPLSAGLRRGARRFRLGAAAVGLAAVLTIGNPPTATADEKLPIGVLPAPLSCAVLTFPGRAGTWPVPMHAPNRGIGLLTMPRASAAVQRWLADLVSDA